MSYSDLFDDHESSIYLGITQVVAALLHVVLILGITFSAPRKAVDDSPPQLEITLVQSHSNETPEDADFLANANQDGGGDTDEALRTKSPLPGTSSTQQAEPMFRPRSEASTQYIRQIDKTMVAETPEPEFANTQSQDQKK